MGGGHSTLIWTGGGGGAAGGLKPDPVSNPLGAQKIHPVTIYLTKTFICIPCTTDGLAILLCITTIIIHTTWTSIARARRRWHRDRVPVINIVVPHAQSLVPRSRACHNHCGLGTRKAREATLL